MRKQPMKTDADGLPVSVAILHPDLGIGGAEQLIINVHMALESKGYYVKMFTPHFDRNRCFDEAKGFDVEVRGSIFPRTLFGKFHALCSYIRMMLCAIHVIGFAGKFDYIIIDQVSLPVPFLRYLTRSKVIFYCHYPDKLLCTERTSLLKKIYRFFLDFLEDVTTVMAHVILVNSEFTKKTVINTSFIARRNRAKWEQKLQVLNPSIKLDLFDDKNKEAPIELAPLKSKIEANKLFLVTSLNRYERKKNLPLAIESFACALPKLQGSTKENVLIIVGGYDPRVNENVQHIEELRAIAKAHGLIENKNIFFLTSISNEARNYLLRVSDVVLYTPENEHFGIVPLEAMYNENIVIACNSGGPLETVKEGKGFIIEPNAEKWGDQICEVHKQGGMHEMRKKAREYVRVSYSFNTFADKMEHIVASLDN